MGVVGRAGALVMVMVEAVEVVEGMEVMMAARSWYGVS